MGLSAEEVPNDLSGDQIETFILLPLPELRRLFKQNGGYNPWANPPVSWKNLKRPKCAEDGAQRRTYFYFII
jgi:hypothetical protein